MSIGFLNSTFAAVFIVKTTTRYKMSQSQSTYDTHLIHNNSISTGDLKEEYDRSTDVDTSVDTFPLCGSSDGDDCQKFKIQKTGHEEKIEYACSDDYEPESLLWEIKSQLINSHINYPHCSYPANGHRSVAKRANCLYLYEYLSCLDDFSNHSTICIDGVNGSCKSTIAAKSNRKYLKINMICPDVTTGSDYNFYVFNFLEYLMVQVLYPVPKSVGSVIWDRDRYSNLRFYFVHYLMYEFRNRVMSIENVEPVYEKLNTLATATHTISVLEYLENIKPSPKTAIFVYGDLLNLSHVLVKRGGITGSFNAKEVNYQVAQYHVYMYFAQILKHPVIDIPFMFKTYEIDINRIQFEILKRINFRKAVTTSDDENIEVTASTPPTLRFVNESFDRTSAIRLQNFCKSCDDQAVYNYSLK